MKHLTFLLGKEIKQWQSSSDADCFNVIYRWKQSGSKRPKIDIDVSESDHLGLGPTLNSYAILSKLVLEKGN